MDTRTQPSAAPTPPPDLRPRRGWSHLPRPDIINAVCTVATGITAWLLLVFLVPAGDLYPIRDAAHLALAAVFCAALLGLCLGVVQAVDDLIGTWQPCGQAVQLRQAARALDWFGFLPAASDATVLDGIRAAAAERHRLQALLDWNGIPRDATTMPDGLQAADQRDAGLAAAEVTKRDAVIDRLTADAARVADEAIGAYIAALAQGATDPEAKADAVIAAYDHARTTSELLGVPLAVDGAGQAGG